MQRDALVLQSAELDAERDVIIHYLAVGPGDGEIGAWVPCNDSTSAQPATPGALPCSIGSWSTFITVQGDG